MGLLQELKTLKNNWVVTIVIIIIRVVLDFSGFSESVRKVGMREWTWNVPARTSQMYSQRTIWDRGDR